MSVLCECVYECARVCCECVCVRVCVCTVCVSECCVSAYMFVCLQVHVCLCQ